MRVARWIKYNVFLDNWMFVIMIPILIAMVVFAVFTMLTWPNREDRAQSRLEQCHASTLVFNYMDSHPGSTVHVDQDWQCAVTPPNGPQVIFPRGQVK